MTTGRRPNFFIVGAPKCGTSSLHSYLGQHPDAFVPNRKDVPFFGSDLEHRLAEGRPETLEAYLASFATARHERRVGDACVWYLYSTRAAQEIERFNPESSIIVMVRDPVELLYSLHSHLLFMTDEDISDFADALAAEPARRAGQRIPAHCRFPASLRYHEVVRLSEQIERYYERFGRERVHVIVYDDLRADTSHVVRQVFSFLGLDPEVPIDLQVVNSNQEPRSGHLHDFFQNPPPRLESAFQAVTPKAFHGRVIPLLSRWNVRRTSREPLDNVLREQLRRELEPEVRRLSELLERDLTHWSAPQASKAGA